MGKAIVASDVGGHKELITHGLNGVLFPAGDSESLASSLKQLLDQEARRRLETEGVNWVKNHRTWEKTTFVYRKIYEEAFRRKGISVGRDFGK